MSKKRVPYTPKKNTACKIMNFTFTSAVSFVFQLCFFACNYPVLIIDIVFHQKLISTKASKEAMKKKVTGNLVRGGGSAVAASAGILGCVVAGPALFAVMAVGMACAGK